MFEKLIAVVDFNEPITPRETPKPEEPKPEPVESQAHKEWAAKRREFMERHTGGREPEGAVLAIMNASIGDEPPFE